MGLRLLAEKSTGGARLVADGSLLQPCKPKVRMQYSDCWSRIRHVQTAQARFRSAMSLEIGRTVLSHLWRNLVARIIGLPGRRAPKSSMLPCTLIVMYYFFVRRRAQRHDTWNPACQLSNSPLSVAPRTIHQHVVLIAETELTRVWFQNVSNRENEG